MPALGGLVVEVFILIAVGGSVRIMNAGLACPDWPLCFGDYIPDYHPQVYFEFIHRVMAGLVALTTFGLALALWFSAAPRSLKALMSGAVILLAAQIVFGGLTVLWQLQAGVVATHLGMGTAFFGLLLWMFLILRSPSGGAAPSDRGLVAWASALMIFIYGQILLGGVVASNYAGLACADFPTCQGLWFPPLTGPVGLQMIHRFGAYFVFTAVWVSWAVLRRQRRVSRRVVGIASWMAFVVCLQLGLGVANVVFRTPALIGVAHLATAVFLLSLAIRQLFFSANPPVSAARAG
jgi:cytochrome c oxidase assembly protein subunit 15